ncbi:MAG: glycoside hydrolase family 43 protein [Clostridiales bacterium]|nr:glycoside hydrolase family 43 protein [Clostridiales bacterium]
MIRNPVLKGFNPDPCVCRKGDDYYAAVSSFEWLPGIPVYHSRDLKNWELYTHVLTGNSAPDLRNLPSAKGIWAPCLTYCQEEDRFYVIYGVMNSMNARCFEAENYLISAEDIRGPWTPPVYLHSAGFDASLFHDEDGRKWIVSLEWETREGYEKPGAICMAEYSPREKRILGYPKRIWSGGTDRGCIEAPHLTRKDGYYYIMCAEGGTGYNHCVTMGRSRNIWGPYEADPMNPILTSVPGESKERNNPDHLKPQYFNPQAPIQKSGHGSYVETPKGEVYMLHLCARPFIPELRCTLGRETALQKMQWTEDGWLRMKDGGGGTLAREYVEESALPECPALQLPEFDDFDGEEPGNWYYSPRLLPAEFADVKVRPGYVRLRGQESVTSLNRVSLLARKLTSVHAVVTTKMEFRPEVYQHSAGLILYYDNMNYIFLRKYYSESLGQSALSVIHLENGIKTGESDNGVPVEEGPLYLRLRIDGRKTWFEWSPDGREYRGIGPVFDTTRFSDEYCQYGEFTGTFVGITCEDRMLHRQCADFDFFEYLADEEAAVE